MIWRHLELTPERLRRWWDTFHADHPGVRVSASDGAIALTSTDGSIARFTGWYPIAEFSDDADALTRLTAVPAELGIILVRRGGYSIGLSRSGQLVSHKTGTRYVQSRTAAGGWSQQRFARRRENQADELTRVASDHAARVLSPLLESLPVAGASRAKTPQLCPGLAVGGDAPLVEGVLVDPRLQCLRDLPRRDFPDLPDPRFKVLQDVVRRRGMVRVAVHNPPKGR